jgi:SnoaL-like domain
MEQNTTIVAWRAASESGDTAAAARCLAPDVEVISPLTAQFRFHGPAQVTDMLAAAFEVIHDIRFHTEVGDGDTWALFYRARAGRVDVEEAQLLRLNHDGLIRELTLFGRPLPALTEVMAGIGPRLLRRQRQPRLARLVTVATGPLAAMTRLGERRLMPKADPNRRTR